MKLMKLSGVVLAVGFTGLVMAQSGAPVVNVAQAQQGNESVQQRLDRIERLLEARTQGQASMMEQLGRLQREVSELRGISEEQAYQLDQIVQRQRDIYQELDRVSQQVRSGGAVSGGASTVGAGSSAAIEAPSLPVTLS